MKVTHTLIISAMCPVKPNMDFYKCIVTTDRIIRTEDITAAADAYTFKKGIIYLTPARKYENIRASKRVARATNSDNPKPQPD